MKVYTVHAQHTFDYDFSVEQTNHGCFKNEADAIEMLKNVASTIKEKYEDKMKEYSDKEDYPDEDSGALYIEEDNRIFYMCFGYQEDRESHTAWIDEWKVK